MDKEYYSNLPQKISVRTEEYLDKAKELANKSFSQVVVNQQPLIPINLAVAMMNMEAAEILASEIGRIADKAAGD